MKQVKHYEDLVVLRYELFNALFLTLPFAPLGKHGAKLPIFAEACQEGLSEGKDPEKIVEEFFEKMLEESPEKAKEVLFLFLQQVERQVVLFDAVERASFPKIKEEETNFLKQEVLDNLKEGRALRLVLTSHPTQFYPSEVLQIIEDLASLIEENAPGKVREILLQLGRTPFKNEKAPTPLSEAKMLIEFFGPVFFDIYTEIHNEWEDDKAPNLELGFWPGGDRDGHPLVTAKTTRETAEALKDFALNTYEKKLKALARRITFKGAKEKLYAIIDQLRSYPDPEGLVYDLKELETIIAEKHDGLFQDLVSSLISSVRLFGFHFASLDIRQSSDVISSLVGKLLALSKRCPDYADYDEGGKFEFLAAHLEEAFPFPVIQKMDFAPPEQDLMEVIPLMKEIQDNNGEKGLHRFIISHTEKAHHLLEVVFLIKWMCPENPPLIDVVPLFESIEDLQKAPKIMEQVTELTPYFHHLKKREKKQTVMLGFSDGTKDGGYATCNWEIQQCKEKLSRLGKEEGIEMIFFDGRGGPPARGGGNTERYYRAVGERIEQKTIQLTIQGQTISSYYGTRDLARNNLYQFLRALTVSKKERKNEDERLHTLSQKAYKRYMALREDPLFIKLLGEATPLSYFGKLKVGSRPPKRKQGELTLESLRAIPFVGAWSQMKVNLPAFYGLGSALKEMEGESLKELYQSSLFFRTLLGNAAQALRKSFFPLTDYLKKDKTFGEIWTLITEEGKLTAQMILEISGQKTLMGEDLVGEMSVSQREEMILPLLVIHHYGLIKQRKAPSDLFEKLILKSIPATINAARNSA